MEIRSSDRDNIRRYAGFQGGSRVTMWLPRREDVEAHFAGQMREGSVDPQGYDIFLKATISAELEDLSFEFDTGVLDGLSRPHQLIHVINGMKEQDIPKDVCTRFVHVATCTPNASSKWVLS